MKNIFAICLILLTYSLPNIVAINKRKILFLIGDYGTGGKERQLTEIIKNLAIDKYDVYLFMKCDNSFFFESIKNRLTSFYSLNKSHFNIIDIFQLWKFAKSIQPDVIISFSTTLCHYSLILNFFGKFNYRLINNSIRNAPLYFNIQMKIEKLLYHFYKEVIANSKAGLHAYNQNGKKGRSVLYNFFDEDRIPALSINKLRKQLKLHKKFTVIMVGSMGKSKDQTIFIKAAAKVLEISDDIQFVLIGGGPRKLEYLSLASTLGIEDSLYFTGVINNVEEYLMISDLSVLISTNSEGLPNFLLESMACGTPILSTSDGGTKELLIHGENGFFINSGDFMTLSKRILYLKNNSDVLNQLRFNCIAMVKKRFNRSIFFQKFEEILDNGTVLLK